MRLFPKLLLSFLAVVLVGVFVVSVLANQAAAREVHGLMMQGGMTTEAGLAQELAGYYRGHGSWEGVEALIGTNASGMGRMMGQRLLIADEQGRVFADSWDEWIGRVLSESDQAAGQPIEVDGRRVGTLIATTGMMGGGMGSTPQTSIERNLLARVNRAVWLAALAAGGAALFVGGLLAYGIVRPIRKLIAATRGVGRGDLSQRVPVSSGDEMGELASAFNSMAADLQDAERLRRDMTADIAHELRNPIAVLQGNLEAVIDGVLPPTPEHLQPLLDQTGLLTRLVDDLRTLALADSGELSLQRMPTDPADLARSVVSRFTSQAQAKGIVLDVEISPDLPTPLLDPQRIDQVVGNLLSNAIRHTPSGGRIVFRVTRDKSIRPAGVTFTVRDTGPGIPPDALPHVFERFYRVDRSRARAEGGTGLGLAIARKLVEAHGGEIRAESEPGRGAAFAFTLPAS